MKRRDRGLNSILIVLTVGGVGFALIVGPLHGALQLAAEQIRAGKSWLLPVAGIAYAVGFFVTRIVEDAFDAIFSKAPFSDIGEEIAPGKEKKHPAWVDTMLNPIGYALFLARVAVTVSVIALAAWLVLWFFFLRQPATGA